MSTTYRQLKESDLLKPVDNKTTGRTRSAQPYFYKIQEQLERSPDKFLGPVNSAFIR